MQQILPSQINKEVFLKYMMFHIFINYVMLGAREQLKPFQ